MGAQAERAQVLYTKRAPSYERGARLRAPFGRRAVAALGLRPGETVLDIACGTGGNFDAIMEVIGPGGRLVGIDLSDDMLARASQRVRRNGWSNVELIRSPVAAAQIPVQADAALFALAHDVLRDPASVANVVAHVRPGGRVATAGVKWAPLWASPLNLVVWLVARRYITSFDGFREPWSLLAAHLADVRVDHLLAGTGYVVSGRLAADA